MANAIAASTRTGRTPALLALLLGTMLMAGLTACADDVLAPEPVKEEDGPGIRPDPKDTTGTVATAGTVSRNDLKFEGDVKQTANGYSVNGAAHLDTELGRVTFAEANLTFTFDAKGKLRNVTGRAKIPSPHERIQFADPVEADIGFFSGRELNRTGSVGILLKDDTDYFVYRVRNSFEMRIATGESGANAVKPIAIRAPLGGEILMVVDYTDPMYYVYGSQDLIGAIGMGWSRNHRIPFVPKHPVLDLGTFDGGTTRTGTFPILKIVSVSGQMVENEDNEVHLSLENPFSSSLRMDYRMGFNGTASLDLFLKNVAGIDIPLGEVSGGLWRELSTRDVFRGHVYLHGVTGNDVSWWPAFIPVKPVQKVSVRAAVESSGNFDVNLAGEFGWELPTGRSTMSGELGLTPDALRLKGTFTAGSEQLSLVGQVTRDATSVGIQPPQFMLAGVHDLVMDVVNARVDEAEKAWNNLQKATSDYQIELSLRGLRSALPKILQTARTTVTNRINSELAKHKGTIYEASLRSHVWAVANPHLQALADLEAAAKEIRDNDQTRKAIEHALRTLAARKTYRTTYTYKVLGITIVSVTITIPILSDADANRLIQAANNVKYIKETSDRMLSMRQIYDAIPSKEIFAQIKKDVANGVARIPTLNEFGFVVEHASGAFSLYAVLAGQRYEFGAINPFDPVAVSNAVSARIVSDFDG